MWRITYIAPRIFARVHLLINEMIKSRLNVVPPKRRLRTYGLGYFLFTDLNEQCMALDQKQWHLNCWRFREHSLYLSLPFLTSISNYIPPKLINLSKDLVILCHSKSRFVFSVYVRVWQVKGKETSQESYNP